MNMSSWIKSYRDKNYPCYLQIGDYYVWLTEKAICYTSHLDIILPNNTVLSPGSPISKDQYDYIISIAKIPTGSDPQFFDD